MAVGPFLGSFTLIYNDYWDSEIDKISKRKASFPLPKGLLTHKGILRASILFMFLAVFFSLLVSPLFLLLIVINIILAFSYSTPPLRLKNRAGLDVITNAIGSGLICSVAGWIVEKPLLDYPVLWGFISMFGVSSFYIPTTIIDQESDKRAGVNTISVKLGKKRAFIVGLICIGMANAIIIYIGLIEYLIDRDFLIIAWPIVVLMVICYAVILSKLTFKSVYRTITALALLMVLGNSLLITYYVGLWTI
jgi:chlorophyll synthase